ncbi:unnamed protein product [Phytophthora lilii]|uniref:Unnamed protein product n=1 Tax=Phytophthora lilii TaxID=2077276 RepID=A0A9W6WQW1_9STRA|nr:unnamed protein product [Phytophthora lilii]
MHAMKAFLSCDSSIVRARTPARLLDANEFLFIATETYHKSSAPFSRTENKDFAIGASSRSSPRNRSVAPLGFDDDQNSAFRPPVLSDPVFSSRNLPTPPPDTPSSTGAAVLGDNSDDDEAQLQSRLGSLLERVKKRQQTSGP